MEKRAGLITTRVKYICEACGRGEMQFVTEQASSLGRFFGYWHKCTHCRRTILLGQKYPHIEYEEVGWEDDDAVVRRQLEGKGYI